MLCLLQVFLAHRWTGLSNGLCSYGATDSLGLPKSDRRTARSHKKTQEDANPAVSFHFMQRGKSACVPKIGPFPSSGLTRLEWASIAGTVPRRIAHPCRGKLMVVVHSRPY